MLDTLDLQILEELEKDSRKSASQIAKKLAKGKATVNYRIKRLEMQGIISGYKYISNQLKLGTFSFGVLVRFNDATQAKEKTFMQQLQTKVAWAQSLTGTWDLIFVIIEESFLSFQKKLEKLFLDNGDLIQTYKFYVGYGGCIMHLKYLYPTSHIRPLLLSAEPRAHLTQPEHDVLEHLKAHPRKPFLEIARDMKNSYDTIKSKWKQLVDQGVLLRCSPIINIESLGYSEHLLMLKMSPNMTIRRSFLEHCRQNPNVVRYVECFGDFDVICNVHAKNAAELKKILYALRHNARNNIIASELIAVSGATI